MDRRIYKIQIPDDKLPARFKNDATMTALFSPVRSSTVNPKDYEYKVAMWRQLIRLYCETNGIYAFSLAQLSDAFQRLDQSPCCLEAVIQAMCNDRSIRSLNDFHRDHASHFSLWDSISHWSRKLMPPLPTVASFLDPNCQFVHLELLQQVAEAIFEKVPVAKRGSLMAFHEFKTLINPTGISTEHAKLLLYCLQDQGRISVRQTSSSSNRNPAVEPFECLIKWADLDGKLNAMTEFDVATYRLELNERKLENTCHSLEVELQGFRSQAKEHLAKGHRGLATSCLKRKRQVEQKLKTKLDSWHNVYMVLERMRELREDSAVFDSYKTALKAFNASKLHTPSGEDAIDDIMTDLGDVLDVQLNVKNMLAKGLDDISAECDEEALNAELEELIQEDRKDPEKDNSKETNEQLLETLQALELNRVPSEEPQVGTQNSLDQLTQQ